MNERFFDRGLRRSAWFWGLLACATGTVAGAIFIIARRELDFLHGMQLLLAVGITLGEIAASIGAYSDIHALRVEWSTAGAHQPVNQLLEEHAARFILRSPQRLVLVVVLIMSGST